MSDTNYAPLLPTKPPEGLVPWLTKHGKLDGEYIIYRSVWIAGEDGKKEKAVKCKCSACGEEWIAPRADVEQGCRYSYAPAPFGFVNNNEDIIDGKEMDCPICGAKATARHIGKIDSRGCGGEVNCVYPLTVHKICGQLAFIIWEISKHIDKDGNAHIWDRYYEAYVFENRKAIRLVGYRRFLGSISWLMEWEQLKRCDDKIGEYSRDFIYPWKKSLLVGTEVENCKLDLYLKANPEKAYPVSYMRLWQRQKNIENLIMQGAGKIVNDKIDRTKTYYSAPQIAHIRGINFYEVKPHRMLRLAKDEFRVLAKDRWSDNDLSFYIEAKNNGIKPEDIAVLRKACGGDWYEVRPVLERGANIMRAARYIAKQKRKFGDPQKLIDFRYLADYWDMAAANGDDLTDDKIRYPHKLTSAHDNITVLVKEKVAAEFQQKFDKRYAELEKFCYSSGGLSIHPARSQKEMITEGKLLDHCVGGYASRHARGETSIFFIRRESEPETPFYTLELDVKTLKVRQNRGYKNCARTDEVQAFEDEWIKFVKKVSAKSAKKPSREKERKAA